MTRFSQFAFGSPSAWILLLVIPAIIVVLFQSERIRRASADPRLSAERLLRVQVMTLILGIFLLLAGTAACLFVLVGTTKQTWTSPLFIIGVIFLGLVILLAAFDLYIVRRNKPVMVFSSIGPLETIKEGAPGALRLLAPFLRVAAISLVIVALARPQVATTEADVFAEGMDMVLTLDLSTSMEAVDFSPPGHRRRTSRIQGAKEVIRKFVQQRSEDRLGLVVFAAEAFTQCPLSLDYSILVSILKSLKTGVIKDGTAIGNAIIVSINRLKDSDAKSKAIILITDGDDNASKISPVQAAQMARDLNIHVFTILVGKGGKVPYPVGPNIFGQMQYQKVEIRTNPELLKKIASISKGKFYRAVDKEALQEDFQDILDHMEKTRLMDPGRFTRHTEVFQLALLPALLALLLELAMRWTRYRRFP